MKLNVLLAAVALVAAGCAPDAPKKVCKTRFFAEIPLSTTYANGNMWTGWAGRWTELPLLVDRESGYDWGTRYHVRRGSMEWTLREMASYGLDGATYNGTRTALAAHLTNGTEKLPAMYVANVQLRTRDPDHFEYKTAVPAMKLYLESPTAWRHNGKPVFVSYWSDRTDTPEQMARKLKDLHAELGEFYYVPDISALSKWKWCGKFGKGEYGEAEAKEMKDLIRSYLRVADGVYFGESNGPKKLDGGETTFDIAYYRDVIIPRMKEVLAEPEFAGQDKLLGLVAGLGHGNPMSFGNAVGQDGTRTLRSTFEAAIAAEPDFIVFFEWDEWNENTLIKPTVWNSYAPKRIIRAEIAAAKGEPNLPLEGDDTTVPNLILSFRKTLTPGEHATFEILAVPEKGATGPAEATLRLLDENDAVVKTFDPVRLDLAKMDEARLVADSADWARLQAIRPELTVTANGRTTVWRDGLPPMEIRLRGTFDHKWATMPLRDIARDAVCSLAMKPAKEPGLVTATVRGESAAGIDRLEVMTEGDRVYSVPGREGEDFVEDENHYVFRLTAVAACWSDDETRKGQLASWTVEGVSDAEWRIGGAPVKGKVARFPGLHKYTPDAFLRIPKTDLATAVLKLDWPKVRQLAVPLARAVENDGWAEVGDQQFMFGVARFFRCDRFWSPVGKTSAEGTALVKPDMPVALSFGYLITPQGRICFSKPVVSGRKSGEKARLRVYSAVRGAAVDVETDAARVLPLDYDLSTRSGAIVHSGAGSLYDGVLGGVAYLATGRNRGGSTFYGSCPAGSGLNTSRAPVQFVESGVASLHFDGTGTYFAIPQASIPKYCGYRLQFEFRPEDPAREQEIFAAGTESQWGQIPMIEFVNGGFVRARIGGYFGDETAATSSAKARKGEWNRYEIIWNVDSVEFVLNGVSSGAIRSVMPGRYDCAAWFGGRVKRFYRGDIRNFRIDYDRKGTYRPVAICQTQTYPLKESLRGYLGRWVDQPLCVDPDIDPANPHDMRIVQEDFERGQRDARSYGIDAFAFFPVGWKGAERLKGGINSSVEGFATIPIISFWQDPDKERSVIRDALANPRGIRIDGRQLIYSYWTDKYNTPEELKGRLDAVRREFGTNFVFIAEITKAGHHKLQEAFRTTGDLTPEQIADLKDTYRRYLRVADGLYPGETHMERKVDREILTRVHMADYLKRVAGLLREVMSEPEFAGQRKYLGLTAVNGHENAYTRGYNTSHNGTRTLRGILDVARTLKPDIIKFSEWDEYNENTCFCPTLYNGFVTKRIVRAFLQDCRGERPSPLDGDDASVPNLAISYRKSLSPGEPLPIEILNIADGTGRGDLKISVSVADENGQILKTFPSRALPSERTADERFVLPTDSLTARALRVKLTWEMPDGRTGEVADGLHAVDFAPRMSWNHKWVKQAIRDLAKMRTAEISYEKDEISAKLECDEPIRYAMVAGGGEILYIHNPDDRVSRFREDGDWAVFQATYLSRLPDQPAGKRSYSFRMKGIPECEWLFGRTVTKGESFRPSWLTMSTEPVYVRVPKKRLKGGTMTVDFKGVVSGEIPLDRAFAQGAYTLGAKGGTMMTLARLNRQAVYPANWKRNACEFRVRPGADRSTMSYLVQVVTMSGKTWRSRPFVQEKGPRNPVLDYDFSPVAGDVVRPTNGERWFYGMLGGWFSPATCRNRGPSTSGALEEGEERNRRDDVDRRPKRKRGEDGAWELVFDGEDDIVGFPWETIPQFGPWGVAFDFKPDSTEGKSVLFASREPGGTCNLWGILLDGDRISVGYCGMLDKDGWVSVASQPGSVRKSAWNRLAVRHTGESLELSLNGKTVSKPSTLPGTSTSTSILGGFPKQGYFRGSVRNFRVR